ncbi:MAG: glycosyltransferase family 2 protein [Oligoflexia bacterium]|nr:glycosyltransferase family 2 protein [Oligoflexia bacterium]
MNILSIVIPAYNEEKFIGNLLEIIKEIDTDKMGFTKEIIVVDDGSKDKTFQIASQFASTHPQLNIKVFMQIPNQGKGAAVRRGIKEATGDYILIQDADLEYFPKDYITMLEAIKKSNAQSNANSLLLVYGSRLLGEIKKNGLLKLFPGKHSRQSVGPWLAGVILSAWTFLLYTRKITDTLTAYKLYPASALKEMNIVTSGFETDHELTAKFIRLGAKIVEVPIDYNPRGKDEGKKIATKDGFKAVWTLFRFRFF